MNEKEIRTLLEEEAKLEAEFLLKLQEQAECMKIEVAAAVKAAIQEDSVRRDADSPVEYQEGWSSENAERQLGILKSMIRPADPEEEAKNPTYRERKRRDALATWANEGPSEEEVQQIQEEWPQFEFHGSKAGALVCRLYRDAKLFSYNELDDSDMEVVAGTSAVDNMRDMLLEFKEMFT